MSSVTQILWWIVDEISCNIPIIAESVYHDIIAIVSKISWKYHIARYMVIPSSNQKPLFHFLRPLQWGKTEMGLWTNNRNSRSNPYMFFCSGEVLENSRWARVSLKLWTNKQKPTKTAVSTSLFRRFGLCVTLHNILHNQQRLPVANPAR